MNIIKMLLVGVIMFHSFAVFAKEGYVNIVVAIEQTKQGKKAKRKIQNKLLSIQKEVRGIETSLSKQRSSLEKEAPLLSEQKRAKKIQQFQQRVAESQKRAEAKRIELKKYEEKVMSPILKNMNKVIAKIAQKEGFTVVNNGNNSILWVHPSLDLTQKVYKAFNKSYK